MIKNKLIKFSATSGLLALALSVSVPFASAATLTFDATSVVSDGVLTLNGAAGSALNVGTTNTTGVITIGHVSASVGNVVINGGITGGTNTLFNNSTTSNITIAGALSTGIYTVGTVAAAGNTIYRGTRDTGTNSLFDNVTTAVTTAFAGQTTGTIAIGGTAGTGLITLGSSTGTGQIVTIGGGATIGSDTVNIGTGTATTLKTVNVGAVGTVTAASTINISNTSDATGTQTVSVGSPAKAANILTLEAGTGATAIQIGNGATAHGIQIGSGAGVNTVILGSTNTTSTLTLNAGVNDTTGGITIVGAINGASPLVLEGTTVNSFETTVAVTDPTADRTVTVPDKTGQVQLASAASVITAGATPTLTVGLSNLYTDTITTDDQNQTITFSGGGTAGDMITIIFQTDSGGSLDEIITFETTLVNSAGTLTLANATAQRYTVTFISDGTVWNEVARTTIQS